MSADSRYTWLSMLVLEGGGGGGMLLSQLRPGPGYRVGCVLVSRTRPGPGSRGEGGT